MITTLNDIERAILLGAVAELERYLTMDYPYYGTERIDHNNRMAIQDAREGFVSAEAARWLGVETSDPAMRMGISRAYASLERKQLIQRQSLGTLHSHTTHLAPTDAGIALAKTLSPQPQTRIER